MGVTVHSHCVESFEGPLQQYVGEGGVAVNCEKTQFFLNTLYVQLYKLDYIAALPLEAGISDAITIVLPVVTGVAA